MNLDITFLGTSAGKPTMDRTVSGLLINRGGERILVDPGEGTQHQMITHETGLGVKTVLLTHIHADHSLGLAGLFHTWDFNGRNQPLTVVLPEESRSYINQLQSVVGGALSFDIRVIGSSPGETPIDFDDFQIKTTEADHRGPAVGYEIVEDDRIGRFNQSRAQALGVPPGPKFGRLQRGESVEAKNGTVVNPEQVLGPPRRGRRILYTGDTRPVLDPTGAITPIDVLIHEATFTSAHATRAHRTCHSTATEAGRVAYALNASQLVLTHLSPRYDDHVGHLEEARVAFDGKTTVASDGTTLSVPFPDSSK